MIADASRELIDDGPRMIKESRVDALVLDSLWRNLDLVAMHLEVHTSMYPSHCIRTSLVKHRSGLMTGRPTRDRKRGRTISRDCLTSYLLSLGAKR